LGARVAIVAGEASGDMLGASLMRAMKERWPDLRFYGIAGPKMIAEGATSLYPMEKLSVRGYVEVLKSLREILAIRRGIARRVLDDRPDLFIGVDAPDFNLGLEAKLKAAGIPSVQYVAPAVWAWRPERIHGLTCCAPSRSRRRCSARRAWRRPTSATRWPTRCRWCPTVSRRARSCASAPPRSASPCCRAAA
jgi:hypothetical protein